MYKIADICPISFNPLKHGFGKGSYIQRFYTSDRILIQVLTNSGESIIGYLNDLSDSTREKLTFKTHSINSTDTLHYVELSLADGCYTITIQDIESEPFEFTSDDGILDETSLFRCSHHDNNSSFDNIWWIGNVQQFIEFRIEAGFKPSGISEKVDNEHFRDQFQSLTHLYAVPYQTLALSIGNASGVPYWVGTLINRMLCVSHFEINEVRYVRSESNVPEQTQVDEWTDLFWFSQLLELNTNSIAGIGGQPQAGDQGIGTAILLDNVKDGDVLRYSEDKSAFLNTDIID